MAKMLELIHPGTNFDFVGYRFYAVTASIIVILIGAISLAVRGVNYGIDTCWYNPVGEFKPEELPIRYQIKRLPELLEIVE